MAKRGETKGSASDAVRGFSACMGYPTDPEGQKLLAQTLEAVCHANNIDPAELVKRCAAASNFCPTPFDLRQIAAEMSRKKAPAGCELCEGTGWVHSVRHVESATFEYDADFSELCRCPLGEFIRAGEREMKQKRQYA